MATQINIDNVLKNIATLIKNRLQFQAPVDTGKLKRSIRVQAFNSKDGVQFRSDYVTYGVFTDLGTGKYYRGEQPNRKWNPRPGKGKGGIKPRYWTNLDRATTFQAARLISRTIAAQAAKIIAGK